MKPSIFVMDRFTPSEDWLIRLVVPGIDGGHAVMFETWIKRQRRDEAEQIAKQIAEMLPNTVYLDPSVDAEP